MSPAPARAAGQRARGNYRGSRHDDAIPHKWGCGAEAGASAGAHRHREGVKAQKIDLEQQAPTLVWPQIDGASLRVACWESSRAVEPC
jgi:hypothetical protein